MPRFAMGPTLRRYFWREVAVPFLLGIGVFTFILLIPAGDSVVVRQTVRR
jgi:hypothetical protein